MPFCSNILLGVRKHDIKYNELQYMCHSPRRLFTRNIEPHIKCFNFSIEKGFLKKNCQSGNVLWQFLAIVLELLDKMGTQPFFPHFFHS